jgi:IS605 OrfB family transposase
VLLTVQVQLKPTVDQAAALTDTLRQANSACDWISARAWTASVFRQYDLHKLAYHECRAQFPILSSQMIVRAIAKVADAYKLDRKVQRTFRPLGSFPYDARGLSWRGEEVSIWTTSGRQRIPFVCGNHQRTLLQYERGEADLVLRDKKFYLFVSVSVPDTEERKALGWLGIDVGVVNIATTSDGTSFSGSHLNSLRRRSNRLRHKLQRKGTKSAKRLLRLRRRKEQRFSNHVNHVISKQIVAAAERTGRGIALENLEGIRSRVRATRKQRRVLHSWAFGDLQSKIAYKAKRAGVQVCFVDPRNTSRECRVCGHTEKGNRKTRDNFACLACGQTADADINAACVIASRADVNRPHVSVEELGNRIQSDHLNSDQGQNLVL